jgi:dienelactone hydrolase
MRIHLSIALVAPVAIAVALAAVVLSAPCSAQDYGREARWASEFVPAIVVGDAVKIKAASGQEFVAIYAAGRAELPAIVLAHGVGVHPDHGIVGTLRSRLCDLGYTTLSVQMPVAASAAELGDYYPKLFPDAADRLHRAGLWLQGKGAQRIVLLGHGMGAWMSNEYLDNHHRATAYTAWVVMGLTGGYSWTMRRYTQPVLDIMGEKDLAPTVSARNRRALALNSDNGSRQVVIAGADHHYAGKEKELATAVDAFVRGLK